MVANKSYTEIVNGWLSDLSGESNDLKLDQYQQCGISDQHGNSCFIYIIEGSDEFVIYSDIEIIPERQTSEFYEKALSLNMDFKLTRGVIIAFDKINRSLTTFFKHSIDACDSIAFNNCISNYFEVTIEITKIITQQTISKNLEDALPRQPFIFNKA